MRYGVGSVHKNDHDPHIERHSCNPPPADRKFVQFCVVLLINGTQYIRIPRETTLKSLLFYFLSNDVTLFYQK